jgi:hypothetical protein
MTRNDEDQSHNLFSFPFLAILHLRCLGMGSIWYGVVPGFWIYLLLSSDILHCIERKMTRS